MRVHIKKEKIIGIVGGVGPYAGIDLQRKIAEQTVASKDQDHLTVFSISQPEQILDRTEYLLGRVTTNPAAAIAKQLILLHKMGAQVAGIPCNTAHAPPIFAEIRSILENAGCEIHLLHMIEETAVFIHTHHPRSKTIGILSTTGTYQARIYPQILEPLGFTAVIPDPVMQETIIHPAIYDLEFGIKSGNISDGREGLLQGVDALQAQGAELIILGCTEMPLALPETKIGPTILIDPTKILARALIREANPHKLRME
jgi:aspartate racemase